MALCRQQKKDLLGREKTIKPKNPLGWVEKKKKEEEEEKQLPTLYATVINLCFG
jgi:hypothetical protein